MSALVTENAPDFTANAVMGDNSFRKFKLSSLKGRYVVLFFYPMDFSFVCPSEILAFKEKYEEFKRRGCELVSVSTDTEYTHFVEVNLNYNYFSPSLSFEVKIQGINKKVTFLSCVNTAAKKSLI